MHQLQSQHFSGKINAHSLKSKLLYQKNALVLDIKHIKYCHKKRPTYLSDIWQHSNMHQFWQVGNTGFLFYITFHRLSNKICQLPVTDWLLRDYLDIASTIIGLSTWWLFIPEPIQRWFG